MIPISPRALTRASLLACASLCATATVHAQSGTWTGPGGGSWSDIANWNSGAGPVADGSGNTADLATLDLPTGAFTVNLDGPRTIGHLNFGDTDAASTAGTWTLAGATTLTLAGTTPTITAGVNTTISPVIDGTAGLTKAGTGNLSLNGANIYTGGTFLNAGKLILRNGNAAGAAANPITAQNGTTIRVENSAFPSQTVTVAGTNANLTLEWGTNGGIALQFTGTADQKITAGSGNPNLSSGAKQFQNFPGTVDIPAGNGMQFRATTLNNGGDNTTFIVDGTLSSRNGGSVALGSLTGSGTVTMGTAGSNNINLTYTIGTKGEDSTFSGGFTDGDTANGKRVAITKTGAGTLTLSSTTGLNHTGGTTVNGGTLKVTGTKAGTGNNSVNSGGILAGTGSLAGTTTVASGGTLAPGDGGIGTLALASLTLNNGSTLDFDFGVGSNDTLTVQAGSTITVTSGVSVDVNGFETNGTYNLINHTGASVSGSVPTAFAAINGNPSKIYSFSDNGSFIQMTVSATNPTNFWKVDGGGTWNLAANWTKNLVPDASGALAKIGPGVSGGGIFTDPALTITMDANRTVGALSFEDDFTAITIDPGAVTPGSLIFDNGASPSTLANINGNHVINAAVVVDPDDLSIDVADTRTLTVNGTVSGSAAGAALTKSGLGTLVLTGSNSYNGGTTVSAGAIAISDDSNLGHPSGALTFAGGTLRLAAPVAGATRGYQVSGANSALIDTNGNDFGYDGVISPAGAATGGLTKSGAGTLFLSAAQTYTGTTTVSGGTLNLSSGASINAGAANVSGGATLAVAGGSLTAGATSSVTGAVLSQSDGTVALNAGLNANTGNPNSNYLIHLTGGSFSASSLTMGRSATIINNPAAGSTAVGLYVNGGAASISGGLTLGNGSGTNSSVSARIDGGSLSVGGAVVVQINSGDRWSVLDVNGGTFTATDAVTGVQVGSGQSGNSAFLVRGGTATVERLLLTQAAASTKTSRLSVTGGALYVGAGGITGNNNGGTGVLDVQLGTATVGAKAGWSSTLAMSLTGTTTFKAADATDAPFDIALTGALSGSGSLAKSGTGTLTLSGANSYSGDTTVGAGTLSLAGSTLSDSGIVDVSATGSATLHLNFTGTDTVGGFSIDGAPQAAGTWGSLASSAAHKTALITGDGILNVVSDPFDAWLTGFPVGTLTGKGDDADGDGLTNLEEFGLDGNPASGAASGKVRSRIETVGAGQALVITLPVRDGASFSGTTSKSATIDDLVYTIGGSNTLDPFDQGVTEIAVSAAGMPTPLTPGWSYRTFRLDGAIGGATPRGPKGFLSATVEDAP